MKLRFFKDITQVPQEETIFFEPTEEKIAQHIDILCSAIDLYLKTEIGKRRCKRGLQLYNSFEEFLKAKYDL